MSNLEVNSISEINFDSISFDEPCRLISEEEQAEIEAVAPINRERLAKLYRGKKLTIDEIAELLDETNHSITKLLRAYGIYKHSHKYLEMTDEVSVDEIYEDEEHTETVFESTSDLTKEEKIEKAKNSDQERLIPDTESGMDDRISREELIQELRERIEKNKED